MRNLFFIILVFIAGESCSESKKAVPMKALFDGGEVQFLHKGAATASGYELTLMSRYWLDKKELSPELSNYFQYQLGKKIKLVIGNDTVAPALFYYIPLIAENEKEIDLKFRLEKEQVDQVKKIIIDDSVFNLHKINLAFN
jgi:hypothetical protein